VAPATSRRMSFIGSTLRTRGMTSTSFGGGGDGVNHSRVFPFQGSLPARRPRLALQTKQVGDHITTPMPRMNEPIVETRLQSSSPVPSGGSRRRGASGRRPSSRAAGWRPRRRTRSSGNWPPCPEARQRHKGVSLSRDRARTAQAPAGWAGAPLTAGALDAPLGPAPTRRSKDRSWRAGACLASTPGGGPRREDCKPSAEDDQRPADPRRRADQQDACADDYCRDRVAERPSKDRMVSSRLMECSP
jgi:hypothetical protein